MSSRHDDLFDPLEPPRGGVERLRARIARFERARARRRRVAGTLVATPLLAALVYIVFVPATRPEPGQPLVAEFSPTRIGLGLDAAPSEPVALPPGDRDTTALRRVSLGTDTVLLYLVGSVE